MSKPSRILFLLNNDFTADSRVLREATALAQAGYSLNILCIRSEKDQVPQEETSPSGFTIHRLLKKRLYKYHCLSLRLLKATFTAFKLGRHTVVHTHDANMAALGWILSRLWGAKLIYDSHEYWQALFDEERDRLKNNPKEKPAVRQKKLRQLSGIEQFERWILPHCNAIITINQSIAVFLREKAGLAVPITLIRNVSERSHLSADLPPKAFHDHFQLDESKRIILYQGQIAEKRGVGQLVEAFIQIPQPLRDSLALILMGPILPGDKAFQEALREQIKQHNLSGQIHFKEAVPPEVLPLWTASADVGVHPILNTSLNHYYCLPNKIFEYLQAGLPVAVSDFPEMAQIVETYNIGHCFDPSDTKSIVQSLSKLFQHPNPKQSYRESLQKAQSDLCWEKESQQLIKLYQTL